MVLCEEFEIDGPLEDEQPLAQLAPAVKKELAEVSHGVPGYAAEVVRDGGALCLRATVDGEALPPGTVIQKLCVFKGDSACLVPRVMAPGSLFQLSLASMWLNRCSIQPS